MGGDGREGKGRRGGKGRRLREERRGATARQTSNPGAATGSMSDPMTLPDLERREMCEILG